MSIYFVDTSWGADLVAKTHQGIWLGRDTVFTYGPLFQKLLSWGPSRHGTSLGSFYIYLWVFQYSTIIISIYVAGAFLLRRQSSWVRVFYLLLLTIFWVPINWILFDIKLLFPLGCFAIFLRMLPAPGTGFWSLCRRAGMVATLIAVAFLISGDAGIYSAAAFVIVVCSSFAYEHDRSSLAGVTKYVALTGSYFFVLVFIINGLLGKVLDFHFWRETYEVSSHYRWSQAVRMFPEMTSIFWLVVTLNLVVFLWQWMIHSRMPSLPSRARTTWLAMLGFGVVCLQTLLVSSEHFHVAIGLFPWIALSVALLLGATEIQVSFWRLMVSVCVVLVITGVFSGPYGLFTSRNWLWSKSAQAGKAACPPGEYEIDEACLGPAYYSKLKAVSDFLRQHSADSDSIGVFPFENIYGVVAKRRVAGAVLQNYVAAGDHLSRKQMNSLEDARPPWVVYSAERQQSFPFNGIPNFTRNPSVWLYWQRWYKREFDAEPGLMLLHRDEERGRRWNMTLTSVLTQPVQSMQGSEEIPLPVSSLGDDWDFIKIKLRANYPVWWKLLKPSIFVVWLHFDRGADGSIPAIVQPDHPYEIWIYPGEQAVLANYFSPDASQWRPTARRRLQSLSLQSLPIDWISVTPSRITIQDVQTVKLSGK